jgi:outer membrane protein insertion porin family
VRADVGYAEPLEGTPEVPPFERFYAGGRSLRGFEYRGVGPHINGNPTGGEWITTQGIEYEYPLVQDTLGVVAFLDAGTLGTTLDAPDAFKWRVSVGFGLRVRIPIFGERPLAFDFGFPLLYEPEDARTLVSFSLGRDF